jgi:hypothetical protein
MAVHVDEHAGRWEPSEVTPETDSLIENAEDEEGNENAEDIHVPIVAPGRTRSNPRSSRRSVRSG